MLMFMLFFFMPIVLDDFKVAFGFGLLTPLVGDDEMHVVLTKGGVGGNVDVFVELYIAYADIFPFGVCFRNLERTAAFLVYLDVDTLDEPFGHDFGLYVQVMPGMDVLRVVVSHFCQVDGGLGGVVVIPARGKGNRCIAYESQHEAHEFQVFHCLCVFLCVFLLFCSEFQSHLQCDVSPWFGHVDEAVITGVVVVAAVKQVVCMHSHVD